MTDYSTQTIDDRSLAPRRLTLAVGRVFAAEPYQTRMIPVTLAERPHPFPSRTRQLSSPAPKILRGQPFGKIGRRRDFCVSGGHQIPPRATGPRCGPGLSLADDRRADRPRARPRTAPRRIRRSLRGARGQCHARYLPVPAGGRRRLAERGRQRPASLHRGLPAGATDHREAAPPVPHAGPHVVRDVRRRPRGARTGRRAAGPPTLAPDARAPRRSSWSGPASPSRSSRSARTGPPARRPSSILLAVAFVGIVISRPAVRRRRPGGAAGPTGSPAVSAPAPSPAPSAAVVGTVRVAGRGEPDAEAHPRPDREHAGAVDRGDHLQGQARRHPQRDRLRLRHDLAGARRAERHQEPVGASGGDGRCRLP